MYRSPIFSESLIAFWSYDNYSILANHSKGGDAKLLAQISSL